MTYKEPLCFAVGAIIGATIGVFVTKRNCDVRINREVEEARHAYNEKLGELSRKNRNKPDVSELVKSVLPDDIQTTTKDPDKHDYMQYATMTKEEPEDVVARGDGPEILGITEDDYMYDRDYEKETVIIYADGVLARDSDDDILDVEETIGANGYDRAQNGLNSAEAVYVRNESAAIDYEIITSDKTYTEATGVFLGGEAR